MRARDKFKSEIIRRIVKTRGTVAGKAREKKKKEISMRKGVGEQRSCHKGGPTYKGKIKGGRGAGYERIRTTGEKVPG